MRIAVISDVHANLPALEAVLDALAREGIDRYACAGDVVGYGPFPNECVEAIAALKPVWVAGNHDLMALGLLGSERCIPLAQQTMAWTREVLEPPARAVLRSLPLRAEVTDGVVVAHGSVDDPEEYVRTPEQAARALARLNRGGETPPVLLLGHTHLAWAWSRRLGGQRQDPGGVVPLGESVVLNPGAVGQSRERRVLARFAVLDLDRGEARFHGVAYDDARCRAELRRQGLPERAHHLPPSRRRRVRDATVQRGRRLLSLVEGGPEPRR